MGRTRGNFYRGALGMVPVDGSDCRFTFQRQRDAQFVEFTCPKDCKPGKFSRNGVYWKCGIMSPDIDVLGDHLRAQGYQFGQASQFRDIGYLAHGGDESGMTTEL